MYTAQQAKTQTIEATIARDRLNNIFKRIEMAARKGLFVLTGVTLSKADRIYLEQWGYKLQDVSNTNFPNMYEISWNI